MIKLNDIRAPELEESVNVDKMSEENVEEAKVEEKEPVIIQ